MGNNGSPADSGSTYQVLVAFRVPAGTGAPQTIVTDPGATPPAGSTISLSRSPGYESELRALAPRPGFTWVG